MDSITKTLATAVVVEPVYLDVQVDKTRLICPDFQTLAMAQKQLREACESANVSLNREPESEPHTLGKYCGMGCVTFTRRFD